MLNKQRFDQIIDLIINRLNHDDCICNAINYLGVLNIITIKEWDLVMNGSLQPKFRELSEQGYQYDVHGNYSQYGPYRFQNKQQRVQFLNQLKESYVQI